MITNTKSCTHTQHHRRSVYSAVAMVNVYSRQPTFRSGARQRTCFHHRYEAKHKKCVSVCALHEVRWFARMLTIFIFEMTKGNDSRHKEKWKNAGKIVSDKNRSHDDRNVLYVYEIEWTSNNIWYALSVRNHQLAEQIKARICRAVVCATNGEFMIPDDGFGSDDDVERRKRVQK